MFVVRVLTPVWCAGSGGGGDKKRALGDAPREDVQVLDHATNVLSKF